MLLKEKQKRLQMQSKERLNGREVISKIILDKPDCLLLFFLPYHFKIIPSYNPFLVFSLFLPSPGQSFRQYKNYPFVYSFSKHISLSLINGFQSCITAEPTTGYIQASLSHLQITKTHKRHNKVIHYILQVYGIGQLFCYIYTIPQSIQEFHH